MTPASFACFAELLKVGSGLAIGPEKTYLLDTRLAPLLKQHGCADLDALAGLLGRGGPVRKAIEAQVIEAMTTNESFFFRDDKPFTHFRGQALPGLLAARAAGSRLRIWSAAASTGQEAYSLAMILAECQAQIGDRSFEIIGTDLAVEPLTRARAGVYSQFEVQRGLPMQMLVKYFKKDGANWRIDDRLRAMVQFRAWNLLADPRPLGMFDVVFCRNVLIYFDQPTKRRVLEAIARQMAPDGRLYLGGAETILGITSQLVAVTNERGVYQLAAAAARGAMAAG
jgi:chemotaxis protein methyltransferase CheR